MILYRRYMYNIMTRRVRLQLCPSHLAVLSDGSGREPKVCACLKPNFEKEERISDMTYRTRLPRLCRPSLSLRSHNTPSLFGRHCNPFLRTCLWQQCWHTAHTGPRKSLCRFLQKPSRVGISSFEQGRDDGILGPQ